MTPYRDRENDCTDPMLNPKMHTPTLRCGGGTSVGVLLAGVTAHARVVVHQYSQQLPLHAEAQAWPPCAQCAVDGDGGDGQQVDGQDSLDWHPLRLRQPVEEQVACTGRHGRMWTCDMGGQSGGVATLRPWTPARASERLQGMVPYPYWACGCAAHALTSATGDGWDQQQQRQAHRTVDIGPPDVPLRKDGACVATIVKGGGGGGGGDSCNRHTRQP